MNTELLTQTTTKILALAAAIGIIANLTDPGIKELDYKLTTNHTQALNNLNNY